ncbi:VanZ family protein ['Paenibacillus yunnanensis' Narsing Rao et al. 2020]|uniref:VanZ family protein n=1 Tax=Paenibacillus tengchongensis TaxID=2608684 RepID=UPI00124C53A0|nr:VanZ family protein [Paenibacillus tengchongensis]
MQFLYAIYIFILLKIILFKFGSVNPGFLWEQLRQSPDNVARQLQWGNFAPLATISVSLRDLSVHSLVNLAGNIALFIPFGIFTYYLSSGSMSGGRRISVSGILLRALGLSLVLECAQALLGIGTFDVDDLLLNTLGGLLGYGVWRLLPQHSKKRPAREA